MSKPTPTYQVKRVNEKKDPQRIYDYAASQNKEMMELMPTYSLEQLLAEYVVTHKCVSS